MSWYPGRCETISCGRIAEEAIKEEVYKVKMPSLNVVALQIVSGIRIGLTEAVNERRRRLDYSVRQSLRFAGCEWRRSSAKLGPHTANGINDLNECNLFTQQSR